MSVKHLYFPLFRHCEIYARILSFTFIVLYVFLDLMNNSFLLNLFHTILGVDFGKQEFLNMGYSW